MSIGYPDARLADTRSATGDLGLDGQIQVQMKLEIQGTEVTVSDLSGKAFSQLSPPIVMHNGAGLRSEARKALDPVPHAHQKSRLLREPTIGDQSESLRREPREPIDTPPSAKATIVKPRPNRDKAGAAW